MAYPESVTWRVEVGGEETTAAFDPVADPLASPGAVASPRVVFVCAHGAGGHMGDRSLLQARDALRSRGLSIVRFNFLYREKGSGRPDPMPRLEECVSAVVARAREELRPEVLLLGGRSMGGRAASMLAARGFPCDGLLLLAYPLHPAGQPEKLRDAHLPAIQVPVLCFNGTRDTLCRRDLMERVLQGVGPRWTMRWLEGADHGFHVLKASGRTDAEVLGEVGAASQEWLARIVREE